MAPRQEGRSSLAVSRKHLSDADQTSRPAPATKTPDSSRRFASGVPEQSLSVALARNPCVRLKATRVICYGYRVGLQVWTIPWLCQSVNCIRGISLLLHYSKFRTFYRSSYWANHPAQKRVIPPSGQSAPANQPASGAPRAGGRAIPRAGQPAPHRVDPEPAQPGRGRIIPEAG